VGQVNPPSSCTGCNHLAGLHQLQQHIFNIVEKPPQQQCEGSNTTMIAGITFRESLTRLKTITFIMNSSDELL
jgi:hypothetical protein